MALIRSASRGVQAERLKARFLAFPCFAPTDASLSPCSSPSRGFRGINGRLPTCHSLSRPTASNRNASAVSE
jgi:hypothetical protein